MYENKDYETVLADMCERINSDIGKGEGTLVNFALAPAAAELEEMYNNLEVADLNSSPLTCDREHLIDFGIVNNIPIKTASRAIWLAEFNVDFEVGERFEAGDLTYLSIQKIDTGKYYLQCETEGIEGNIKPDDELLPIEFIEEYESGELVELIEEAEADEDTEVYRERYLADRKTEHSMSGNRAAYKKLIKSQPGVAAVKLERVTKDRKRINAYILSGTWGKPGDDVVSTVQEIIDPIGQQGDGAGEAMFFHVVDIYPVEETVIDVSAEFELETEVTFDGVLSGLQAALDEYFVTLNKTWEETEKGSLIVRTLKVAEALATVEGVVDVRDLLINGAGDNITLGVNAIPVRGVIENVN